MSQYFTEFMFIHVFSHLFVLRRGETGVEVVHLVSSAVHRPVVGLHWNLQWWVLSLQHPFLANITEETLYNMVNINCCSGHTAVLWCVALTCLSLWGFRYSKSRRPPTLQRLGGIRWWPLHRANRCPRLSATGQTSTRSPAHTQSRW